MELFGRRQIFTATEQITAENVVKLLNELLPVHAANMQEEDYLFWYRRGKQPILNRTKIVRPEICNKITENHAAEIVAFKNGYFLTQPAYYVSRKDEDTASDKVKQLNEYLYLSGKHAADNKVVDWFHTVGVGVLYVEPGRGKNEPPVRCYALDPRSSFVVYSLRPGNEPLMGVNIVIVNDGDNKTHAVFDVFTKRQFFRIKGDAIGATAGRYVPTVKANEVIEVKRNVLGEIPIIEYQYENNRMGAFEPVVSMLDSINLTQSNRMDGIEQFIQSLMVFYNCTLGEDEKGNQITPQYIREAGAIFLKSVNMEKADLKILAEQLDQAQTQVLLDNMYERILTIVGMPSTTKGGSSTSDTGTAVLYRDGWYQADVWAQNTTDLFCEANKRFDRIVLRILGLKNKLRIEADEFELQITRNETANILTKSQAAMNLKALGFAPEIAFARSGVSNDPVADVKKSQKYIDALWGVEQQPVAQNEQVSTAE